MDNPYRAALEEIGGVLDGVDDAAVDELCRQLSEAKRVVVYGCGREALQIRGFATRLFHLGFDVSVVGDMTCPPVGPGDVFLATSGPGELATVLALMAQAKKGGARTVVLTAEADGSAARQADEVLVIPAQTMASDQGAAARSVLPMGSVYEGALFVLFEVMVLKLRDLKGATPEAMRARHTNLE
jgi:6-phospho-3-hexuloisomerase